MGIQNHMFDFDESIFQALELLADNGDPVIDSDTVLGRAALKHLDHEDITELEEEMLYELVMKKSEEIERLEQLREFDRLMAKD